MTTIDEKIRYVKARLDGAIRFERNPVEAEKWRKQLTELEVERLARKEQARATSDLR